MLWVMPPFLPFALSLVLRLSARVKSTAAAQQASGLVTLPLIIIAYGQSTGALFGASVSGWWIGAVAWVIALVLAVPRRAVRDPRPPPRRRQRGLSGTSQFPKSGDSGHMWPDSPEGRARTLNRPTGLADQF